jgi:hypothetical protein
MANMRIFWVFAFLTLSSNVNQFQLFSLIKKKLGIFLDVSAPFGLMKCNGMKRNRVEWNEMERNGINIPFHCLDILERREQN